MAITAHPRLREGSAASANNLMCARVLVKLPAVAAAVAATVATDHRWDTERCIAQLWEKTSWSGRSSDCSAEAKATSPQYTHAGDTHARLSCAIGSAEACNDKHSPRSAPHHLSTSLAPGAPCAFPQQHAHTFPCSPVLHAMASGTTSLASRDLCNQDSQSGGLQTKPQFRPDRAVLTSQALAET